MGCGLGTASPHNHAVLLRIVNYMMRYTSHGKNGKDCCQSLYDFYVGDDPFIERVRVEEMG